MIETTDWDAYPAECRARFLDATRTNHKAQKHVIDQILDDYNLWLSVENLIVD